MGYKKASKTGKEVARITKLYVHALNQCVINAEQYSGVEDKAIMLDLRSIDTNVALYDALFACVMHSALTGCTISPASTNIRASVENISLCCEMVLFTKLATEVELLGGTWWKTHVTHAKNPDYLFMCCLEVVVEMRLAGGIKNGEE